jgi:hypothetical protein
MASLKFLILITVFIVLLDINLEHEIEFMHNLTDTLSCIQIYQQQHNKQMSCPAMGQLLSNTLYYKRFFPYYSFNVLGGLDSEGKLPQALNVIFKPFLFIDAPFFFFFGLNSKTTGKGCVFTYDAVGSYERVGYSSQGSGSTLIMPFLDNQLKSPSPLLLPALVRCRPKLWFYVFSSASICYICLILICDL